MQNIAKVRKRILAGLIDYIMYFVLLVLYIYLFGEPTETGAYVVNGMKALPLFFVWFIYFPLIEGLFSQTMGKKIVGIRVTSLQGREVGVGTCTLRHVLDFIDFSFAGLVGVIVMKSSQKNQRVGDHVAGTLVVEDKFAKCQYCNEDLSLDAHELQTGIFTCPKCKKQNRPLDLVDAQEV